MTVSVILTTVIDPPANVAAVVGTDVRFSCRINSTNHIRWEFYPHGSDEEITVFNGEHVDPRLEHRISADCGNARCEITLHEVQMSDAGLYACFETTKSTAFIASLTVLRKIRDNCSVVCHSV